MSLLNLPFLLCKKEDAMPPEMLEGVDFSDEKQMEEFSKTMEVALMKAFKGEPLISSFVGGNFREFVEEGFFDV